MKFPRGFLLFSYGLFTIAAQTLLFREFITTFEGNDITMGLFFASWFLWIALGALLAFKSPDFSDTLLRHIEIVFLFYIPAFVLQFLLIVRAREIAGVASYQLMSIRTIVPLSILVNAPVSFLTGLFFPLACRWVGQDHKLAVSHVYILEAAGSLFGGFGVTALLAVGINSITIFFILALIVSLSAVCVEIAKIKISPGADKLRILPASLLSILILVCLAVGADKNINRFVQQVKWSRLLPKKSFVRSFQTAQAEYLYGTYRGQWIVLRESNPCEVLPDKSATGRIAAIVLSQNPAAKRILVVGSGLGLCSDFLALPQIERVTWAHCDSEYLQKLDKFLPDEFKVADARLTRAAGDVRSLLDGQKNYYDIAIINLPEATSAVLNRYYTLEFYNQLKNSLADGGVLAVHVPGGENIMGTELINLGASTKLTLEKVFSRLVLVPGEDSWFVVSDSQNLTNQPGTLADNFAKIKNSRDVFVPQGLLSVYLPDRAKAAMENYAAADLPKRLLVNRDSFPLTSLYSLLLAAKQSGSPVTRFVKLLALTGETVFLVPIFIFVLLRIIYILKNKPDRGQSVFDGTFLVFSAGLLGIGVVIVLMYLYQTRFGSLYLHIGVISSVFMIGIAAGAAITRLLRFKFEPLLFSLILLNIIVLGAIAYWPLEKWSHPAFAAAFLLCGFCTGGYFPLAANRLRDSGLETGMAGGKLEMADHLGAAAGGLVTGLALIPVLGVKAALFVFAVLILANVAAALLRMYEPDKISTSAGPVFNTRMFGYILFGIAASIIVCSNLLTAAGSSLRPNLPQYAAKILAGDKYIEQASATLTGDKKISYYKVYETKDKLVGYIFSSIDFAPQVSGFGGPMNLAVHVDVQGRLIDFNILRSNETPSYLELLTRWRNNLKQRILFQPQPFAGVDAVTGATISSKAVLSSLTLAGQKFAAEVLNQTAQVAAKSQPRWAAYLPDRGAIYMVTAVILTLIVVNYGQFTSRLAVLIFNLIVGGVFLNAQYSTEQIATLLSFQMPALALTGTFLLTSGIPLLGLFFGNIYCGYICPFGILQELVGYIVPARFKQPLLRETMQKARFVKYILLFALVLFFFISRNRETLASDPLIGVFNFRFANIRSFIYIIAAIALAGSLFYTRFWCRYFCPAGAFLSLFNNFVLLKHRLPPKHFAKCEFGLTAKDNMDCIYCDRCRYVSNALLPQETLPLGRHPAPLLKYFVAIVLMAVAFASTASVNKFLNSFPPGGEYAAATASSAGRPRDVNIEQIRKMIEEKKLSDREAQYYKKAE